MNRRFANSALSLLRTSVAWLAGACFAAPLIWMAVVSIKPEDQASAPGIRLLPTFTDEQGDSLGLADPAYWSEAARQAVENYQVMWNSPIADFPVYLRNSTIIAVLTVIGATLSSAIVAFGFSRIRWKGRDGVFLLVLGSMMIPPAVLMAPQYLMFKSLGAVGTIVPLVLPAWFGTAFGIYLLRQFFLTIPHELDEAARLDGCSSAGTFIRVILPLSRPALAIVALLTFAGSWNDFQGPLIYLNHQDQFTMSLGLQAFHMQHGGTPWNLVMAASVLVVAPVLLLYAMARSQFEFGSAEGGIKE